MKKDLLLPLNIQFFGEEGETGANESEVAAPTEVEESTATEEISSTEESTEVEDSNVQSAEENAKYAAARRRAEEEFNKRIQEMDAEYARRFEGYENPITHQPIRTQKDYLEALDAQEKLQRDEELRNKGIDPQMFEDMVNRQVQNNPVVQQAQVVLEQAQKSQFENLVNEGLKEIAKLNPNIKTINDVMDGSEKATQIVKYVDNGMTLVDAYKLAHFDDLMSGKVKSVKQATLNNMNGTSHLNQTDGVADSNEVELEIPQNELAQWKKAFPHASAAELRKKYNRVQNN